jgi:hypothetical protein
MANPYDDISLTGAAAKPSGNPYDAIPLRDPSDVRGALVSAMNANPDAAGRAARLARQIGSPAAAVEAHLPEVESIVKVDYYAKMIERAPRTEDFLRNPDKARMAHDDVENLSAWESAGQFLKNSGKALASGVPAFNEGFWGVGQAGGEVLSKLTKPLVGIGLPDVGDSAAQFFGDQRKISQAIKQSLMTVPEGNISAGWYSGLQSLTMNMLTLPAAFMSGNPVLSLVPMAATTGGQAYGQARDKGVGVGSSLAFGASQAAIEYATEKLPVAWLLKDIKAGAGFGKMLGRQMLAEVPGEQAATALQDLNEWAVLNPQKPFADYIKERPGAFVQTLVATMVGAGGQVGTIKLADMAIQAAQAKEQQAVEAGKAGQLLAEMNKLAAASKVRERDPETAREFFQSILDDGNDSVWITPDALAQSGMAEQMAQAIPAVAEQLGSASQTGHDIRIPVADLMATMAGPDLAQSILQHVATEPGGFTTTTAEEYMQSGKAEELKAEIDRVLGEKDGDDSFAASSQEVEDAVFAELQSAGRHAESVNRTDAILHRHFFSVMAAKLGEMPKALFDRYAIRVVAKAGGDDGSLDQTAWHGTPHVWEPEPGFPHGRPRLDKMGTGEGAQAYGWGWYSAEADGVANEYAAKLAKPVVLFNGVRAKDLKVSERAKQLAEWIESRSGAMQYGHQGDSARADFARLPQDVKEELGNVDVYDGGTLYKLDIPDDVLPHLLDWDRPLSEQPEVLAALETDPQMGKSSIGWRGAPSGAWERAMGGKSRNGEWLYREITNNDQKAASAALRALGIPGLRYLDGNSRADGKGTYNYVIWDQPTLDRIALLERNGEKLDAIREANILRQSDQSPRGTFSPSKNTIALLKDANLSTFLHESGHFFLEVMADLASQPMAPAAVQQDMHAILDWFGVADMPTWANLEFEERRSYHEKFARGFELYLAEGKAPSIELHGVFQRFRAWLLKVYTSLKSLNVSLTPEVRGVFDRMLATTEDIKQAEQARSMINLFSTAEQAGMSQEDFAAYHALGTDATNVAIEELQARGMRDMQWIKNARVRVLKKLQQESKAKRAEVKMTARRDVMSQPVYRAWQFLTAKIGADDVVDVAAKPKSDPRELNPETDSLFKAIAKLGGINKAEAVSTWGTDPADKPTSGVFGMPVWRVEGGLSIDGMAEALAQHGYLTQDENGRVDVRELEQLFADELRGSPQYSNAVDASSMMDQPPKAGEDMANHGGLRAGRLNLDGLRDTSLSSDQIEVLKARRMTAAGGLHPDVVAELFPEFGSGDALVQALVAAVPPLEMIDALTDQRMLEQFGELSSPEAIAQAADMAIHNEVRARAIATELATLEKALNVRGDAGNDRNGRRRTFAVLPAAAREFSNAMISRLKIRDIKPAQYSGSAARAGRAAAKAEKSGDIETAASEKRTQLLNIYATRAAHEAIEEARKIDEFFRRVIGGKDATVGKSRDMDLVNAARAVLAAYGYGGKAKSAVAYVEVVQKNDPTWMADVIRKAVEEAEANGKPIKDLTLDELRALKEDVDALWHLAERSRTMEIDGVLMDRKTVADALFRRMQELGITQHAPGESSAITDDEMRAMNFSSIKAILRRVESWVDQQDGGERFGPFRRYLWTPIKDAADAYRAAKAERLRAFRDAFLAIAPSMTRCLVAAPELGYTFGKESGGVAMNEILHAILHTGNESNKRKLLVGRGWASVLPGGAIDTGRWDAFVARMIDSGKLTKAHYDFAQKVWDQMEAMKPAAQQAHRDATGKYFEEVTATPFVTPFGAYRGGYVPAMVDSRIVKDMELKKLVEEGNDGMSYVFPSTSKGFTKSRVEYNRPLLLDMRSLPQHIDRVLLFSHLEVPIRDAARLIGFEPVADAINRRDHGAITGMLRPWLNRTARQQVTTPIAGAGFMTGMVNTIRNRTSMAYMFANVSNAAQQITGVLLAGLKVRPSSLASATARYINAPRETAAEVSRLSPYMAHRMDGEVHAMLGEIESIMIDPTLYERAQEWTKRHSFFLQQAVDNVMGPIIWMGAYNEAMEEKFNPKDAARLADSVIRQTQGSSLPEDISRIESGPAYARLFTQFAGYFNMQANLLGSEIGKVMQEAGLKKGAGRMAYILLLGFYAPALVAEAVAQMFKGGPGDDDKDGEYLDDWLMALFVYGPMRNITAMVPVVGAAANSAIARFNGNPVDDRMSVAPAVGAMEAGAGVPFDLYKAVKGEGDAQRAVRDVSTLISIATGLPAHALARPVGYVSGVAQGKTDPTGAIDFTRGVVTGAASPESRGR